MKTYTFASSILVSVLMLQSGSMSGQGVGGAASPVPANLLECADLTSALRTVADQDTRLRDWANLGRYREANSRVTRAEAVFMGDSITDFWQQDRFGAFFPGKNYVDRGI